MDPITIMMLIGAATGATGGGFANGKRIKKNNEEFDIFNKRLAANSRAKIRYADRLKGQMENANLEASESAKRGAADAFQETAKGEAAAGQSGTVGGTPFYLLGKFAADAQESLRTASVMRANSLAAMRAEGVEGLEQYSDRSDEIERMIEGVAEEANYLSSGLGWALSVGTGAVAGAQTAASIGTSLEKTGMFASADLAAPAKPAGTFLNGESASELEAFSYGKGPKLKLKPFTPKESLGLQVPRDLGMGYGSKFDLSRDKTLFGDDPAFKGIFDFSDNYAL